MARKSKRRTSSKSSGLPRELTRVTPLSKTVALICFIGIPVIAFMYGMRFQQENPPADTTLAPPPVVKLVPRNMTVTPSPKKMPVNSLVK